MAAKTGTIAVRGKRPPRSPKAGKEKEIWGRKRMVGTSVRKKRTGKGAQVVTNAVGNRRGERGEQQTTAKAGSTKEENTT